MIKINSLSNYVYFDKKRRVIIKEYSQDEFRKHFKNQEISVLQKLNFTFKQVNKNIIEIEQIEFKEFVDDNISLQDLAGISNALKVLHHTDISGLEKAGFEKAYYNFLLKGNGSKVGYYSNSEKYIAEKALSILYSGKQVLLHNDLVAGNILKVKKKIVFIDYEFSGIGNQIFDLASFFTERDLSEKQKSLLITCFDKDINFDDLRIVSAFLQIFWTRWALYKYQSTNQIEYKKIAIHKYKGYKKLLKKWTYRSLYI